MKLQELNLETITEEPPQTNKQANKNSIENMIQETNKLKISVDLPTQVPTTFYSFEYYWRMLKDDINALSQYYKMIPPENIPSIIKESLSSDLLYSYFDVILNIYLPNNEIEHSMKILRSLAKTARIKLQLAFLTMDQKKGIYATLIFFKYKD